MHTLHSNISICLMGWCHFVQCLSLPLSLSLYLFHYFYLPPSLFIYLILSLSVSLSLFFSLSLYPSQWSVVVDFAQEKSKTSGCRTKILFFNDLLLKLNFLFVSIERERYATILNSTEMRSIEIGQCFSTEVPPITPAGSLKML